MNELAQGGCYSNKILNVFPKLSAIRWRKAREGVHIRPDSFFLSSILQKTYLLTSAYCARTGFVKSEPIMDLSAGDRSVMEY